jgi:hypothetical protein
LYKTLKLSFKDEQKCIKTYYLTPKLHKTLYFNSKTPKLSHFEPKNFKIYQKTASKEFQIHKSQTYIFPTKHQILTKNSKNLEHIQRFQITYATPVNYLTITSKTALPKTGPFSLCH